MSHKILELISVTPESTLVEHGVYIRPAASTSAESFGQGRVFVMGDAAHPMRPWGQGYTQAVEDAYALGRAVGKGGSAGGIDLESLQVKITIGYYWFLRSYYMSGIPGTCQAASVRIPLARAVCSSWVMQHTACACGARGTPRQLRMGMLWAALWARGESAGLTWKACR
jgi:hypothetical protein